MGGVGSVPHVIITAFMQWCTTADRQVNPHTLVKCRELAVSKYILPHTACWVMWQTEINSIVHVDVEVLNFGGGVMSY